MEDKRLTLLPHEIESALWKRLTAHYEDKLNTLRVRNDGNLTHEDTIRLRARITEIKALLALANPAPATVENDSI